MHTRTDIAVIAFAVLCIATSLALGGLMLIDSAEQGAQSVGRLPVNVHSAQAHGLTVPGTARVTTAQVIE
jgi:hypothetical protein